MVKAAYGYTAYGEANPALTKTAAGFNANGNLYRYTGKRFDPAARAYDMGARHYFPGAGRWFQQDVYTDALANLALSSDPLTQNRYAFTAANPVNYIEVDGHRAAAVGGSAGIVKPTGGKSPPKGGGKVITNDAIPNFKPPIKTTTPKNGGSISFVDDSDSYESFAIPIGEREVVV